jgi:hypothetical protein
MTRFLDQKTIDVGGNLVVMTMPSVDLDDMADAAGDVLKQSRDALWDTLQQFKWGTIDAKVGDLAEKYFKAANEADYRFIRSVLILTSNGLIGSQTLKIGDKVSNDGTPVLGEVGFHKPSEPSRASRTIRLPGNWISARRPGTGWCMARSNSSGSASRGLSATRH